MNLKVIVDVVIRPSEISRNIVRGGYLKEGLFLLFLVELWNTLKLNYFLPLFIRDNAKTLMFTPSYNIKLFECLAGYVFQIVMLLLFAMILKYSVQFLFRHRDHVRYFSIFSFLCVLSLIKVIIGPIQIIISWITHSNAIYLILESLGAIWILVLIVIFLKESYKLLLWKRVVIVILCCIISRIIFYPLLKTISSFISVYKT